MLGFCPPIPLRPLTSTRKRAFPVEVEGADGWSDWIRPLPGYRMACCDCGLVHDLELRVDDAGNPNFRARRNTRSTGQLRRQMVRRGEGLVRQA